MRTGILRSAKALAAIVAIATLARLAAAALPLRAAHGHTPPRSPQPRAILFRDARVFDGTRVIERTSVLVSDGRIAEIGASIAPPADAEVVDAAGKTLLPGLIDAHTHAFGDALRDALVFGVTTELDMFTDAHARARAARGAGGRQRAGRADLFSAGTLVTAPGGHGTEYGIAHPDDRRAGRRRRRSSTRASPRARTTSRSSYDDGRAYGMDIPTLDARTLRAVDRGRAPPRQARRRAHRHARGRAHRARGRRRRARASVRRPRAGPRLRRAGRPARRVRRSRR